MSAGDGKDQAVERLVAEFRTLSPDQVRRLQEKLLKTNGNGNDFEGEGMTPPNARGWTVAELLATEFPPARCAIPGILQEGLNILGGRPKVGKSWLGLQASHSVGTGGKYLGIDVEKGRVLYLALEDTPRRLKSRIVDMGIPSIDTIQFHTEWRPLHEGGLNDLIIQVAADDYRLVVIDTLSRAIPGVDQNDPTVIGPIMASLQSLGQRQNIAILVVDHIRKPMGIAGDPIDDIISSTAKTAIADTILALYKEQGKPGAILAGRGRDIEDVNLKLTFDRELCCWQSEGDASQLALTERRQEILDALRALGRSQLEDIARMVGQPKSNTYKRLQDLCNAGMAKRFKIEGEGVFYEPI
jgi:RecA-family ATPase